MVLGIRPEHLRIEPAAPHAGTVSLVEPMGNHQVVWIEHSGLTLAALQHEPGALAAGDPVRFDIDRRRLSLFDANTGLRL